MKIFGSVVFLFVGYFTNAMCEHFKVDSKITGRACILLTIDATFNLTYTEDRVTESSPLFNMTGAKVVDSSSNCGNEIVGTTSVLTISLFPTHERLMLTFVRQGGTVAMATRFTLEPKKHFKNWNKTDTVDLVDDRHLMVGSDTPTSYLCYTEENIRSSTNKPFVLTMAVTNLQVQAYRIKNSAFGPVRECGQDLITSTLQPETTVMPHNETTTPEHKPTTVPHSETTMPHSDTTTEPSSETTTQPQPETTTEPQPESTTEHQTETTTEPSIETSTKPRDESTTSVPIETTETTRTTPTSSQPPNTQHKYVVRDKEEVCIVLKGDVWFEIPYQRKDLTTATRNITIPDNVKVSGSCHFNGTDSAQEITLTFFNTSWVLDIVIAKERHGVHENSVLLHAFSDTSDYSWQALRLSYVIDDNFPNAKTPGAKANAVADGTFGKFKGNTDGSYKCNAEQELDFGKDKKMKMDLSKMQYRAFGTTNSTDFSNTGVLECPADSNNPSKGGSNKTLGIALGLSLAALVVIVIAAGLVVRYRKKKQAEEPYESIN